MEKALDSILRPPKMKSTGSGEPVMHSGPQTPLRPSASEFELEEASSTSSALRGIHRSTQRKAVLRPIADTDAPGTDALRRDLELLAQVRDRHVVEILGTHTQNGKLWCATEAIAGEDLAMQLRKG